MTALPLFSPTEPRRRASKYGPPESRGSRNTPIGLLPPWEDPNVPTMDTLPAARTWRERREQILRELRTELALGEVAHAAKRRHPTRQAFRGSALLAMLERTRVAIAIWERDLELGPHQDTAPRAEECTRATLR